MCLNCGYFTYRKTNKKKWELLSDDDGIKELWEEDGTTHITVLVFQPRLVCLKYGEIEVNREDLEWLWEIGNKSAEIIREDHFKPKD